MEEPRFKVGDDVWFIDLSNKARRARINAVQLKETTDESGAPVMMPYYRIFGQGIGYFERSLCATESQLYKKVFGHLHEVKGISVPNDIFDNIDDWIRHDLNNRVAYCMVADITDEGHTELGVFATDSNVKTSIVVASALLKVPLHLEMMGICVEAAKRGDRGLATLTAVMLRETDKEKTANMN